MLESALPFGLEGLKNKSSLLLLGQEPNCIICPLRGEPARRGMEGPGKKPRLRQQRRLFAGGMHQIPSITSTQIKNQVNFLSGSASSLFLPYQLITQKTVRHAIRTTQRVCACYLLGVAVFPCCPHSSRALPSSAPLPSCINRCFPALRQRAIHGQSHPAPCKTANKNPAAGTRGQVATCARAEPLRGSGTCPGGRPPKTAA